MCTSNPVLSGKSGVNFCYTGLQMSIPCRVKLNFIYNVVTLVTQTSFTAPVPHILQLLLVFYYLSPQLFCLVFFVLGQLLEHPNVKHQSILSPSNPLFPTSITSRNIFFFFLKYQIYSCNLNQVAKASGVYILIDALWQTQKFSAHVIKLMDFSLY